MPFHSWRAVRHERALDFLSAGQVLNVYGSLRVFAATHQSSTLLTNRGHHVEG